MHGSERNQVRHYFILTVLAVLGLHSLPGNASEKATGHNSNLEWRKDNRGRNVLTNRNVSSSAELDSNTPGSSSRSKSGIVIVKRKSKPILLSNRIVTKKTPKYVRRYLRDYVELTEWDIEELAKKYGSRFNLNPATIMAVIKAESDFDVNAVSSKGAQGLMQLMPETSKFLKVRDPFDPEQNIRAGSQYLAMMIDRYRQRKLALAAYNAGPSTVDRYKGVPPFKETRAYITRVSRYEREYLARFQ